MDPVLAGIAAVIVLQIVILGVVLNVRGLLAKPPKISPAPSASGPEVRPQPRPDVPFQKRRDPYPPQQPSRPRPEAPVRPPVAAPTAAPIDRSLRDINLKLKTVERDQEAARREVQGVLNQSSSGERRPDQSQRPGSDRGNDRDRGRDQDRDRGRDGRDRGRGRGRGGRDDRPPYRTDGQGPRQDYGQPPPRPPLPIQQADSGNAAPAIEQPSFRPPTPQAPPAAPASPIVDFEVSMVARPPVASSPAPSPEPQQPQGGGDVEHGRRITVKRRPLSQGTDEAGTQEPATDSSTPQEPPAPVDYGRRR